MRVVIAMVASLLFIGLASAQNVHTVRIDGQPLIYIKEGQTRGCGLRMIGGQEPAISGGDFQMFDVSVNIFLPGHAMVKLVSYNTTPAELSTGKPPRTVRLAHGWIKAPNALATRPKDGKSAEGEDGASLLYNTDVDAVFAILKAQIDGRPINIGLKREGEATERIYAGAIGLSNEETEQLTQCLSELRRR